MMDKPDKPYFSLESLAERWEISVKSLRRMIWRNELKAVRIGPIGKDGQPKLVRVPLAEVKRYELSRPAA